MSLGRLKGSPAAQARLKAIALTDGMRWCPTGWTASSLLHETVPSEEVCVCVWCGVCVWRVLFVCVCVYVCGCVCLCVCVRE